MLFQNDAMNSDYRHMYASEAKRLFEQDSTVLIFLPGNGTGRQEKIELSELGCSWGEVVKAVYKLTNSKRWRSYFVLDPG